MVKVNGAKTRKSRQIFCPRLQVFFDEFCKIFKNTFFIEYLRATTSEIWELAGNNIINVNLKET